MSLTYILRQSGSQTVEPNTSSAYKQGIYRQIRLLNVYWLELLKNLIALKVALHGAAVFCDALEPTAISTVIIGIVR